MLSAAPGILRELVALLGREETLHAFHSTLLRAVTGVRPIVECGTVLEFRSEEVERIEQRVLEDHGFEPSRHRLEIYGLCRDCRNAGVALPPGGLSCPFETV